jgi:hypothetical protein
MDFEEYTHEYYKQIMSRSKYTDMREPRLEQAKKVIIDTDPGGDDAQALVLAFHMAKKLGIDILGVTTVAGNAVLEQVVLNT